MKRVGVTSVLVGALMLMSAAPASASIHPLVAAFCGAAVASSNSHVLDPVGQTPTSDNPNDWTVSTLRALQATGFLTLIRDANGNVVGFSIAPTVPAVKDGSFPAFVNCAKLNP